MQEHEGKKKVFHHRESWQNFRDTGLFWFINTILHVFGWVLVVIENQESGELMDAYPARTICRGFPDADNTEGYQKVNKWMAENGEELLKEAHDDS